MHFERDSNTFSINAKCCFEGQASELTAAQGKVTSIAVGGTKSTTVRSKACHSFSD
jgi:hypothetical protein